MHSDASLTQKCVFTTAAPRCWPFLLVSLFCNRQSTVAFLTIKSFSVRLPSKAIDALH